MFIDLLQVLFLEAFETVRGLRVNHSEKDESESLFPKEELWLT
jgi:hypothetical protein